LKQAYSFGGRFLCMMLLFAVTVESSLTHNGIVRYKNSNL